MAKVYVKLYDPYTISGNDFATVRSDAPRRILFSPNQMHAISVSSLRDGCLLFNNENQVPFEFSLTRQQKVIAKVQFHPVEGELQINTNWWVDEHGVMNREIHSNPDLVRSFHLNIDVDVVGIGRMDIKVNESGFAACVFSRELLFVRMNGNHAVPRLAGFIEYEKERFLRNPSNFNHPAMDEVFKARFRQWFMDDFLNRN